MSSPKLKKAVLVLFVLVALTGVIFLFRWPDKPAAKHPEFGTIYTAMMSESYLDTQTKWEKVEAKIRQWLRLPKHPDPPKSGLPVGPAVLGWSIHHNSPGLRDGWIYLRDVMPRSTGVNQPLWEIALTGKRRLADVSGKDFNGEFYGMNDPRVQMCLGPIGTGAPSSCRRDRFCLRGWPPTIPWYT